MTLISGSILVLAVVVFFAAIYLEREIQRDCVGLKKQISQVNERICSARGDAVIILGQLSETTKIVRDLDEKFKKNAEAIVAEEARTGEALRSIWEILDVLPGLEQDMDTLLNRNDGSEIVKQLGALMKQSSDTLSRDDEVRLSKSMEEGMANLLQYAAGRAPGVEVRL